jgi:hypothetical protein
MKNLNNQNNTDLKVLRVFLDRVSQLRINHVFNIYHGSAPEYLCEHFNINQGNTRGASINESGRFGALKSDSTHHFFRNVNVKNTFTSHIDKKILDIFENHCEIYKLFSTCCEEYVSLNVE